MNHDDIRGVTPYSLEAEQSILGALMLDNDAIDRVDGLGREHFYPMYAAGNEPDVPKAMTAIQVVDRYENVEDLARKDAMARHREWEADWKPHCDPAAAWIGRAAC
ncbi:hypothetical protein R82526_00763 [Ralstonia mannitolilytica]|uniref:DnaB-like helicase N-terminal domain-containing protein n=1 Tax=Ralstonia mannitolilytica TaxID=105219 RepID=UPI0028F4CDE5|nr:DnaB-like helicase N-terminal domain-containing protein [Ralstonia mannitolilytica]CAJ0680529.1 hypothetical protein R82526_00763 [Ralstonia mannitolilytica]